MLITSSVVLSVPMPSLVMLGLLLSMSGRLGRMCPQASVLSTSKAVRRAMKLWDVSGDGKVWKVQLDDRILVVILVLPEGPERVRFPTVLRMLRLVSQRLVPCLLGFRSSWGWQVGAGEG